MTTSLKASSLITKLDALTSIHADMTLLQAKCFLAIVERPGMSQTDLYTRLGVSDSLASRVCDILGAHGRGKVSAMKVIVAYVDPSDRRVRRLQLTPKGHALAQTLLAA